MVFWITRSCILVEGKHLQCRWRQDIARETIRLLLLRWRYSPGWVLASLQYTSKPPDPLLCPSIRLFPSFSDPWTRHPTISFLVFLFVFLHTAFRATSFFWNCGVLHSFYMTKSSYSLAFYKPDNVLPLNYSF
jgi:hypothetical protein